MASTILLRANLGKITNSKTILNTQYKIRQCNSDDIQALGHLYFQSYDKGNACETLEDAILDIQKSYNGFFWYFLERDVQIN